MHAVSYPIPLVAGALILLLGCYSNNGGLIDLDGGTRGSGSAGPASGDGFGGAGGGGVGPDGGGTGGGTGGPGGASGNAGSSGSGGDDGEPLTGEWNPAVIIDSHEGIGLNPHVAIGVDGRAVVLWVQSFLGEYKVWANRYAPVWGWEGDSLIGTTDGSVSDLTDTSQPHVVLDADGIATAAWANYGDPVVRGLVSRRYVAPDGWGDPGTIYDGASTAGDARLAVDASGRVMAVFSTGTGAWANYFESPDGWGEAEIIDNERNAPVGIQVGLEAGGDGWAVWSQAPAGIHYNIFGNVFSASGWGDAGRIEEEMTGSTFDPQLAIDASGNVLFVWWQTGALQMQVWSNRWDVSENALTEPQRLGSGGKEDAPAIASDPRGNGTAVWIQAGAFSGAPSQVVASRYRPGSGWKASEIIAEGNVTSDPRVAMDSEGNAILTYTLQASTYAHTYSEGQWSPAARLSLGGSHQTSLGMGPEGHAVATWRQGADIWAATFE